MKVSQELLAISKMITHWVMAIKKTIVDYRFFIECDIMSLLWACYRFSIFLVAVYPSSDFTFTKLISAGNCGMFVVCRFSP